MKKNNNLVLIRVLQCSHSGGDYHLNRGLIMCPGFARYALFGSRSGDVLPEKIEVTVSNFYRPGCVRVRFDGGLAKLPRFKRPPGSDREQFVYSAARELLIRTGLVAGDLTGWRPIIESGCSVWVSATPIN